MKYLVCILILALIWGLLTHISHAGGQEIQEKDAWKGELIDGTIITEERLSKIVLEHKKRLRMDKGGIRANLGGSNLTGANLAGADLSKAILRGANLIKADLSVANLREADLTKAKLAEADLTGANLSASEPPRDEPARGGPHRGDPLRVGPHRGGPQ